LNNKAQAIAVAFDILSKKSNAFPPKTALAALLLDGSQDERLGIATGTKRGRGLEQP
jgi:hypothetical protein